MNVGRETADYDKTVTIGHHEADIYPQLHWSSPLGVNYSTMELIDATISLVMLDEMFRRRERKHFSKKVEDCIVHHR